MTDETKNTELVVEFEAALVAVECSACGRKKKAGAPFCLSCWYAVPVWARNWMAPGPGDDRACESFRIWRANLVQIERRIKRIGWDFHSWAEVEEAGYKLLNVSHCRALGCGARIGWVEDAVGNCTPLNVEGEQQFQPHRISCKNPGVYREKRTVQASARRRKRAK